MKTLHECTPTQLCCQAQGTALVLKLLKALFLPYTVTSKGEPKLHQSWPMDPAVWCGMAFPSWMDPAQLKSMFC